MLKHLDEQGPDPEVFREFCSATNLALRATKMTLQSIVRAMYILVVLMLTDMRDGEKAFLLNAPSVPHRVIVCSAKEVKGF